MRPSMTTQSLYFITSPSSSIPINNSNMLFLRTNNNNNNAILRSSSLSSRIESSHSSLNLIHNKIPYRGGGGRVSSTTSTPSKTSSLFTAVSARNNVSDNDKSLFTKSMTLFGSMWGSLGVIYILAKAIVRVLPIALEPFKKSSTSSLVLSPIQWSLYVTSCLFFAYFEGYKGFHLKFSPLVVRRSFTMVPGTKQGNNPINYLLAPLYSMGLFAATRKRMIVSWSISIGVTIIVAFVKKLSPVARCILDAGVVVGLSVGSMSILYYYVRSMITGILPTIDPCLPIAIATVKTAKATKKE